MQYLSEQVDENEKIKTQLETWIDELDSCLVGDDRILIDNYKATISKIPQKAYERSHLSKSPSPVLYKSDFLEVILSDNMLTNLEMYMDSNIGIVFNEEIYRTMEHCMDDLTLLLGLKEQIVYDWTNNGENMNLRDKFKYKDMDQLFYDLAHPILIKLIDQLKVFLLDPFNRVLFLNKFSSRKIILEKSKSYPEKRLRTRFPNKCCQYVCLTDGILYILYFDELNPTEIDISLENLEFFIFKQHDELPIDSTYLGNPRLISGDQYTISVWFAITNSKNITGEKFLYYFDGQFNKYGKSGKIAVSFERYETDYIFKVYDNLFDEISGKRYHTMASVKILNDKLYNNSLFHIVISKDANALSFYVNTNKVEVKINNIPSSESNRVTSDPQFPEKLTMSNMWIAEFHLSEDEVNELNQIQSPPN